MEEIKNAAFLVVVFMGTIVLLYPLRSRPLLGAYFVSVTWLPYITFSDGISIRIAYFLVPMVCLYLTWKKILRGRGKLRPPVPLLTLTLAYTLVLMISSFINQSSLTPPSYSFLVLWILGVVFFVLIHCAYLEHLSHDEIEKVAIKLMRAFLWIGTAVFFVAALEYIDPDMVHNYFSPKILEDNRWGTRGDLADIGIKRLGSTIGSPNGLGAFMILPAIYSLALFAGNHRVRYLPTFLVMVFTVLFFANSRGALMGIVIATILMLIRLRKYGLLAFSCVIGCVFFLFFWQILSGGSDSSPYANSAKMDFYLFGIRVPALLIERAYFWASSLEIMGSHPAHLAFGFGVSNELLYDAIQKRGAHNIVFTNLNFFGLVGLGTLSMLVFITLRDTLRSPHIYSQALGYALIGMLVHSMVDDILYFNTGVMWVVFPLLAVHLRLNKMLSQARDRCLVVGKRSLKPSVFRDQAMVPTRA